MCQCCDYQALAAEELRNRIMTDLEDVLESSEGSGNDGLAMVAM